MCLFAFGKLFCDLWYIGISDQLNSIHVAVAITLSNYFIELTDLSLQYAGTLAISFLK